MRLSVAVISALLLAGAAPALAQTPERSPQSPTPQPTRVSTAQPQRVVLICDADAATRTAFTRQYGAEPVFLSAREAVEAKAAGQGWTTPRCMTEREHARYARLTQAYAAH
jgi:hypothetical protein